MPLVNPGSQRVTITKIITDMTNSRLVATASRDPLGWLIPLFLIPSEFN